MSGVIEPWVLVGDAVTGAPTPRQGWLGERICAAPLPIRAHVESQGLCLRAPEDINPGLVALTEDVIARAVGLSSIVARCVREAHLLSANAGFDISHSEPHWRSRIFVSVPERADLIGALRLAESVIHEAMHLQLTDFEAIHPVVEDEVGTMPSPWRRERRPLRGVVHGLFVFSCLSAYFQTIVALGAGPGRSHIQKRIKEIQADLETIDFERLVQGLTPVGAALACEWRGLALVSRSGQSVILAAAEKGAGVAEGMKAQKALDA